MEPQVARKIRLLTLAVRNDPGSARAWGRLGENFDVHGLQREAVQSYERAAELDPTEFRWPYYRSVILEALGDSAALDALERSRKLRPDYPPLLLRLGQAYTDAGQLDDAEAAYEAALAQDSSLAHAHLGLARLDLDREQLERARDHLRAAEQLDPGFREAHALLSETYRRLGVPEDAARESRAAAALPERHFFADSIYSARLSEGVSSRWYQVRGRAYLQRGLYDAAAGQFEQALRIRPNADAYNSLGIVRQYQKRPDDAIQLHRAALRLRPEFREALTNLASALYSTGKVKEAIQTATKARKLDPTYGQAYLNLGIYYAGSGQPARAIATLRAGLDSAAYDARIANRLAWMLATTRSAALRNGPQAVRLAERVAGETGGTIPEALDVLAAAYAEAGEFDRAVRMATRALELSREAGRADAATAIGKRLQLYRQRRPYRE